MSLSVSTRLGTLLKRFSFLLKALWIFFPGLLFVVLAYLGLVSLSQGKDLIRQSAEHSFGGVFLFLAAMFWICTTWYTARLVAYGRDDLFEGAPGVHRHTPRLLAYSIFYVLWIAIFYLDETCEERNWVKLVVLLLEGLLYWLLNKWISKRLIENEIPDEKHEAQLRLLSRWAWFAISISALCTMVFWAYGLLKGLLWALPIIQAALLYLFIVRRPLSKVAGKKRQSKIADRNGFQGMPPSWPKLNEYMDWVLKPASDSHLDKSVATGCIQNDAAQPKVREIEDPIFILYHVFAALGLLAYFLAVFYLPAARLISSFPLLMLCFAILLGVGNFLTFLSKESKINLHFILFVLVIAGGLIRDPHRVELLAQQNRYHMRPTLKEYTEQWIEWRRAELDTASSYPLLFVLADGGASRSGYWVTRVLNELHEDSSFPFSRHLFCLSGASGGSVGNGVFLAQLAEEKRNQKSKGKRLANSMMQEDLLSFPLARLLGPDILSGLSPFKDRARVLEKALEYPKNKAVDTALSPWIRGDIGALIPDSSNQLPLLCINTTQVQNGAPALISTLHIAHSKAFGERTDVLGLLCMERSMRLSTAMILGARFPYVSPGGRIGDHYFVDGGYFDNSGAGAVHEMLMALDCMATDSTLQLSKYWKKLHVMVIHISNSPREENSPKSIHPAINNLATPIITLAGSYNVQTSVNNERLKQYLRQNYPKQTRYWDINLYGNETKIRFPMNWVISKSTLGSMDVQLKRVPELEKLRDSLRTRKSIRYPKRCLSIVE